MPAGYFRCVDCALAALEMAGLTGANAKWGAITEALVNVTALQALANAPSTGTTYATALSHFANIVMHLCGVPRSVIFPGAPGVGVPAVYLEIYIGHATNRIKTSTVLGVMAALRWWHVDKGVPSPTTFAFMKDKLDGLKRYISELRDLGQITIAPELVAAHSLRRTAANEFRDACRAQGIPDGQITAYLLCFCRWVSEKSVQVYVMQHANDMVRILAGAPPTSS